MSKKKESENMATILPRELCASLERVKTFAESFATASNVMVVMGAGASTSAGIPDFRTPGTGLYDNLQAYGLPSPEAVFNIDFFKSNPVPFNMLIRELLPGAHKPTPTHAFLRMLSDQNKLQRVYTQNIDGLEKLAGLPEDRVVQCHGGFNTAHCIECNKQHDMQLIRDCCKMNADCTPDGASESGHVIPTCECGGLVKPQITFFGEAMPQAWKKTVIDDLEACDCLVVIGTSLNVMPVALLPRLVYKDVPRMVINLTPVGEEDGMFAREGDAFLQGTCDDGVKRLCDLSGDSDEFAKVVSSIDTEFTRASHASPPQPQNRVLTTDVILQINMGFLDGPNERKMDEKEARSNYPALRCHMCNMLPSSEDVDNTTHVQRICFKSLEVGEWTSCDYGTWASLTPHPPVTYNMQLTATIKHKTPLSFATVAAVIEAIYDNGASHPFTHEEDANYFLYPYHSIISDLDDGICCGH
jgi:NAD+-dependent protein deacetylase sirtuin 2